MLAAYASLPRGGRRLGPGGRGVLYSTFNDTRLGGGWQAEVRANRNNNERVSEAHIQEKPKVIRVFFANGDGSVVSYGFARKRRGLICLIVRSSYRSVGNR
jgi:hypothetical protein